MTSNEISALDLAFLCLERPTAPMHLGAVAIFSAERATDGARVASLLAERAHQVPRLRVRARASWLGQSYWEEQSGFRGTHHVHARHLPHPGGRDELAALVSEIVAEPLDLSGPPWAAFVVTGLDGGRFAVVVKLHHALADGATAAEVFGGLLDGCQPTERTDRSDTPSWIEFGRSVLETLTEPERVVSLARTAVQQAGDVVDISSAMLRHARLPASGSPMSAGSTAAKHVALLGVRMADLRRVRTRHGGTTNDVLLAVVTGALRRWLTTRGHPLDGMCLRALIPINYRPRGSDRTGNQLSGYLCDLPVGEPDPKARLMAIRAAMDRNKAAGPLRGPGAFPVLAGRCLAPLHRLVTPLIGASASLLFDTIVTNVPLPGVSVSLDGARMRELYPLAPLAAGQAISIAASQYGEKMHVGIHANRAALPDIEKLTESVPYAVLELDDAAAR
jgi:WS/DGAT/MGAT family acyltransferase